MKTNKFIVLEGIDGAGKSTVAHVISETFKDSIGVFAEPTKNSPYSGAIRQVLSGKNESNENNLLKLFKLDRLWNVQNQILPSVQKNKLTILDRYFFSTAAYQGQNQQEVISIMDDYMANPEILKPDFVFYLKLDADVAMKRIVSRKANLDIFEKKIILEKIIENYNYIFSEYGFPFPVMFLDARQNPGENVKHIINKVFSVV